MTRNAARAAALGQERLDDAVLERMEGDHDQPAAGLEDALGGGEPGRKLGQFLVDEDTQRLERPRRRMDAVGPRVDHGADDVGERAGGRDRRLGAGRDDGACATRRAKRSSPSVAMIAGEIALGGVRDHIGGARSVAAHAHVERTVEPERKAALGLVELHRRHADVEHHAVDGLVAELARHRVEIGEPVLDQREAAADLQDQPGAVRDRGLVAVDADHPRIGAQGSLARSRRRRTCRRYRCRRRGH